MNSQNKSPEKLNQDYFKSLIATRASIASLNISIAGLFFSLICLPITWYVAILGYQIEPLQSKVNILIICVAVFMLITFIVANFSLTRRILIKHQGLTGIWLTVFSFLLSFILMFMSYLITQFDKPNEIWYGSKYSIIVILILAVTYLCSLIYNVFWLKRQLKIGFSEERATANYFARASAYSPKSLWIIFGFSMLGAFLTGNLKQVFGLVLGVFFGVIFSRLSIEYAYAAYLLNIDKEYWINYIDEPEMTLKKKLILRSKKPSTYVISGIILLVVIALIEDKYEVSETFRIVTSYVYIAIFIWFLVAFIMWAVKKIKDRNS